MTFSVQSVRHWANCLEYLRDGHSVISHAPRYSLQAAMLEYLHRVYKDLDFTHFVTIHPGDCISGAVVDWQVCADTVAHHLHFAPTPPCETDSDFRWFLRDVLGDNSAVRLLVAIALSASSTVEGRFKIVSALERVLNDRGPGNGFSIVVFDDYSLYYYEWWRTQGVSRWDSLHREHLRPMAADEIVSLLQRSFASANDDTLAAVAAKVEKLTGGHIGLIKELLEDLVRSKALPPASYWTKKAPLLLAGGSVLDSIRRALQEDASGLTLRALEYENGKPLYDYSSPTVQTLRRIGVLQSSTPGSARLCPGSVRDLVRELARHLKARVPVGTIYRETDNAFDPTSLRISRDDIIVLHISDVHLGAPYAFRIASDAESRHDRRSAAEMLAADIEACGIPHVDAVVISGDFTETADDVEFDQAREVLTEVLDAAKVGWKRAIVVAGNHDLRWIVPAPGEAATARVSREEFQRFRRDTDMQGDPAADVTLVVSRSGKSGLRVVSLDTNLVEGPEAGGIGYISLDALQNANAMLAALSVPKEVERLATWIVVHHHVFPVTSAFVSAAQKRKVSVMANATALLSFANTWNAEMILHGHEHQPSITLSRRWPGDHGKGLAPLCVAGAGSFGCKREYLGPFARNHYFTHVRRKDDILIRSRMTGDEGFGWVAHGDLSVPAPPLETRRNSDRNGGKSNKRRS